MFMPTLQIGRVEAGVSFSFERQIGPTDPLAGIPLSLRLQSHNFVFGPSQTTMLASGAGNGEANQAYMQIAPFTWFGPKGVAVLQCTISSSDSGLSWTISDNNTGSLYTGNGTGVDDPSQVVIWVPSGGSIPGPTVVSQTSQFYAPFGLFQDAACTTPSVNYGDPIGGWKDMFTGGNPVASQSNAMQRPLLQFAPNGSGIWIPCPKGDGVDDILIAPLATASIIFSLYSGVNANTISDGKFFCNGAGSGVQFALLSGTRSLLYENVSFNGFGTATSSWETWSSARPSSPASAWVNGIIKNNNITGIPNTPTTATSLFDAAAQSSPSSVSLAAAMVAGVSHSTTDRQKIEAYITSLLPA